MGKRTSVKLTPRRFLLRLLRFTFLFFLFIFCIQDILVFPGVLFSFFAEAPKAPPGVESIRVLAADGTDLEMWKEAASFTAPGKAPQPCLFFHGNGGSMAEFYPIQRWLTRLGCNAYALDTRGFGSSHGWPSEKGIELDAEAAILEVAKREKVTPKEVMVVGLSVGTGAAAYIAAKYQTKALILLAAYSNLRDRAREEPLLGILSPLLRYEFSTKDYVAALKDTCLVVARGSNDNVIRPHHSDIILKSYQGSLPPQSVLVEGAGHNDLVFRGGGKIGEAIVSCE